MSGKADFIMNVANAQARSECRREPFRRKCPHCYGAGPKPGWIEQDNNGPIVACPICNPDGEKERAWEMAEVERDWQRRDSR